MTNVTPQSSLTADTNALRDIKPPVDIPNSLLWLWILLALVALLTVAFWLWRRSRSKQTQGPVTPPVPAHVRARQRLDAALGLIDQPREFCTAVSDAIRQYLEERFNFHAPERTTEEFLHELAATELLTPDQKESLGEFLQRCDLVKFARYEPREPELHELHGSALRLVEETEPTPEVVHVEGAHAADPSPPPQS